MNSSTTTTISRLKQGKSRARIRRIDASLLARKNKNYRDEQALKLLESKGKDGKENSQILQVTPEEVIFRDVRPGQIYQMKVTVKNKTKSVHRIRVFQPKSTLFRCDYELAGRIAPGLSIDLIVSFESKSKGEFEDVIKIISDDNYLYEMKVFAYSPMAKIIFEPFINLGFIQVGKEKVEELWFKNEGQDEGTVQIAQGEFSYLKLEPSGEFTIKPNSVKRVKLTYFAHEPGVFRGSLPVSTDGKSFLEAIDINATCVEYMQFLIDKEGKEMDSIEFGEVVYGQRSRSHGFLINNSPESLYFSLSYIKGHHSSYNQENDIKSPHEIGQEQTQRVLSIEPSEGYIDSYAQLPLTFICNCDVEEDHKIWSKNYCLSKGEIEGDSMSKEVQYTCVIFFKKNRLQRADEDLTKIVKLNALATCPKVTFSQTSINFDSCFLGKSLKQDLEIENQGNFDVNVSFPRWSHFGIEPNNIKIPAQTKNNFKVNFSPKNLGKIKIQAQIMINETYPLTLKLEGVSIPDPASLKNRHIHEAPKKFHGNRLLKTGQSLGSLEPKNQEYRMGVSSSNNIVKVANNSTLSSAASLQRINPLKISSKDKFEYLKHNRISRLKKRKECFLKRRILEVEKRIKNSKRNPFSSITQNKKPKKKGFNKGKPGVPSLPTENSINLGDSNVDSGYDATANANRLSMLSFYGNIHSTEGMEPPKIDLPETQKSLFVVRPIGRYEPLEKMVSMMLNHDTLGYIKPFDESPPKFSSMSRDINQVLDGEMLKKIHAGPKILNFGKCFVKSISMKYFYIRNDLKGAILVALILDDPCIEDSYNKAQVIPSGQIACFEVAFRALDLGVASKVISYKINEKKTFNFMIKADVQLVELSLSTQHLEIDFHDETNALETSKEVTLINKGNSDAHFEWSCLNPAFSFEPEVGTVSSYGELVVQVIYSPTETKTFDNTFVDLRIKDGRSQSLEITGRVSDTIVTVSKLINFESMAVDEKKEKKMVLVNDNKKASAVYVINRAKLHPMIRLSKFEGKIHAGAQESISAVFSSNIPKSFNFNIEVLWRGGSRSLINVQAEVIVPIITIEESYFDYGVITYGDTKELEMNLANESPIPAKLKLDLRSKPTANPGIQCLKIEQIKESENDPDCLEEIEPSVSAARGRKAPRTFGGELKDRKDYNLSDDESMEEPEEEGNEDDEENSSMMMQHEDQKSFYLMTLAANTSYKFKLIFHPEDTLGYSFKLPIYLGKSSGHNTELQKLVTCRSVHPKVVLKPINGLRDFGKIIIPPNMEAPKTERMTLWIENPHPSNSLNYTIGTEELLKEGVFSLSKNEGVIQPERLAGIDIIFKPHVPGAWDFRLPLYIDDDRDNKKAEIRLVGAADQPKIMFDRRQIILPAVPLNIESKCTFRIINEGYQTVNLKSILPKDHLVELKVVFPQGRSLSSNKNRLNVEVSFKSKKPISFTSKIDFEDDQQTTYSIFVSGTADNSLFSNYFYFRSSQEPAVIQRHADDPIIALPYKREGTAPSVEDGTSKMSEQPAPSHTQSKLSSLTKGVHTLGYSPIPLEELQDHCNFLCFWLSETVPNVNMAEFPSSIITEHGKQLLMAIQFLSKREVPAPLKISIEERKSEKVKKVIGLYSEIIELLKGRGALLNEIRPEFLLGLSDFVYYLKHYPIDNAHPITQRLKEQDFHYLSMYSWCVVFNQILKLFYLGRVNVNKYKQLRRVSEQGAGSPRHKAIPKGYLNRSNVYSPAEVILLMWCEESLKETSKRSQKLVHFDKDLKNGLALASLVQIHTDGSANPGLKMNQNAKNKHDYDTNMRSLRHCLADLGFHALGSYHDMSSQSSLQRVLLLVSLFLQLPSFTPKEEIIFECVLNEMIVKNVKINNSNSGNRVVYSVTLEGSKDFSILEDTVVVEAGQIKYFPVKFYARVSREVSARLTFKGLKDSVLSMMPLVYDLHSHVMSRISCKKIQIKDVPLYQKKAREIVVDNPFDRDVVFNIELMHLPTTRLLKKRMKMERRGAIPSSQKSGGNGLVIVPSFFLQRRRVHIARKKSAKVALVYLPTSFETHPCHIIFTCDSVGELQYDLIGIPKTPDVKTLSIDTIFDSNRPNYLSLGLAYPQRTNAFSELERFVSQGAPEISNYVRNMIEKTKKSENFKIEPATGSKDVHYPGYLQLHPPASMNKEDKGRSAKSPTSKEAQNSLKVNLNFRNPVKSYISRFMLKNGDLTDVRVYDLNITLLPKTFKAEIDFETSAGIKLVQEIPVSNPLSREANFKVERALNSSDCKNPGYFNYPASLLVSSNSNSFLPVTFRPKWVGKSLTAICITNTVNKEKFQYMLKGEALDPLAIEHFKYACNVGKEQIHQIRIENQEPYDIDYDVKIDLTGAEGPDTFKIHSQQQSYYPLKLKPSLGGIYAGSITFTAKDGSYIWYSMEMETLGQKNILTLEMNSTIRTQTTQEIKLENPSHERVEYIVRINGDDLHGPNKIAIEACSSKNYSLTFLPLGVYSKAGSVSFLNSKAGEILYHVNMKSGADKVHKLPLFQAEIGKMIEQKIEIFNPSKKHTKIKSINSNPENYEVSPDNFDLNPFSTKIVTIRYFPNELDLQNTGEIEFVSKSLGIWKYLVFGRGTEPTEFEVRERTAKLNKQGSVIVQFANPFKTSILLNVILEAEGSSNEIFWLKSNSNKKVALKPGQKINVQVAYCPTQVRTYSSRLILKLSDKMCWVFPIEIVTEAETPTKELFLGTVCNEMKRHRFELDLPGLASFSEEDSFAVEITNIHNLALSTFKRWFAIENDKILFDVEKGVVSFGVNFLPHKPFKVVGELAIIRKSGGIWKFKLKVVSQEPPILDLIKIESPLNETSTVRFVLNSGERMAAPFTARFSHDSASEFNVFPKRDTLQPANKEGTAINLSFTPVEYGKEKKGILIIETERRYWSYKIEGTFPKLEKPQLTNRKNISNLYQKKTAGSQIPQMWNLNELLLQLL